MKSFDIYLHERQTECDILISSLTLYDDGWSVCSRTLIDGSLGKYLLHKILTIHNGLEFGSRLDRMIKTSYERLNVGAELDVSADFKEYVWVNTDGSEMILDAEEVKLLARTYDKFTDQLEIGVQIDPSTTKYINTNNGLVLSSNVDINVEKYERVDCPVLILSDVAVATGKPIDPERSILEIAVDAAPTLRRKRKLMEIDEYNPMPDSSDTLESLDFIVLGE